MTQNFLIYSIFGVFGILLGFLFFQFFDLKKRLDILSGKDNKGLEATLKILLEKSERNEKNIQEILRSVSALKDIAKISFQKLGMVRYNPFKNVGGNQSFSIVLLDSQNSGFVITSLYIKETSRIFAKSINQGKSEHPLSDEEKKALEQAQTQH